VAVLGTGVIELELFPEGPADVPAPPPGVIGHGAVIEAGVVVRRVIVHAPSLPPLTPSVPTACRQWVGHTRQRTPRARRARSRTANARSDPDEPHPHDVARHRRVLRPAPTQATFNPAPGRRLAALRSAP
jgi:hypothetical protein